MRNSNLVFEIQGILWVLRMLRIVVGNNAYIYVGSCLPQKGLSPLWSCQGSKGTQRQPQGSSHALPSMKKLSITHKAPGNLWNWFPFISMFRTLTPLYLLTRLILKTLFSSQNPYCHPHFKAEGTEVAMSCSWEKTVGIYWDNKSKAPHGRIAVADTKNKQTNKTLL